MINDGVLITAKNRPSAWRLRAKEVAARCTPEHSIQNVQQPHEMSALIKKKSH